MRSRGLALAREEARILATAIDQAEAGGSHVVVERTIAKLRKAKPDPILGLSTIDQPGLINVTAAPASSERFEVVLNRIVGTCLARTRLAECEVALSAEGLERRFAEEHLFGDDDDHGFSPPHH